MKKAIIFIDANNWYHNVKKFFEPGDVDMSKIYNQSMTDGCKSNVVTNYSIFSSMLKNHWITFAIAACH